MAKLNIKNLNKDYQAVKVLKNINVDIVDGEFVVLVGPSGCGKSTLLRTIAGLEEVTSGEIQIKDKVVNNIDPAERGVAMVFQSYALYPHMNVAENMSFGLKMAKKPKAFIEERVNSAAKILKIEPLLDRKPKQLSGGQRQRVAIGRAIVREPEVFLFDEPLSNLDAELRVQMRIELVKLHERLKSTMIYVTHDQVEAMTMADKIVVLKDGYVEQIGSPDDLYQLPRNLFVASFIGSPKMNFFKSKISGQTKGETEITENSGDVTKFKIPVGFNPEGDKKIGLNHLKDQTVGTQVTLGVRPEHIRLEKEKGFSSVKLTTVISEVLGSTTHIHCKTASNEDVIVEVRGNPHLKNGERIVGYFDPSYVYLFETKDKCNRLKQR